MRRIFVVALVPFAAFCVLSLLDLSGAASATGKSGDGPTQSSGAVQDVKPAGKETTRILPEKFGNVDIDSGTYLQLRERYTNLLRGLTPESASDVRLRDAALKQMLRQEEALARKGRKTNRPSQVTTAASWIELGPAPLPNGETVQSGVTAPMSGRATAVVVDPTNSNKIYLGTAQGGVWRSLDGGTTWTPIFDTAQSLAIGALALAPSSPTTLYVGTGESGLRLVGPFFQYFGDGVYRIDNADTAANLVGPINPVYSTGLSTPTTCFGGRSIRQIVVHPTDPATIFVSTAGSFAGVGVVQLGNQIPPLGLRGLYRSTNATAAANAVTFQKLKVVDDNSFDSPPTGNSAIWDLALEPGNPNNLLATAAGNGSEADKGGVFRSTDALAANPTFTQTLGTLSPDGLAMRLAINKVGSVVTVYVTSNEDSSNVSCSGAAEQGRVRKSVDGGITWSAPLPAAEGFCGGLCIYDNPIAVDPNDANLVYLGGSARGTCADVLKRSADGGTTFTRDDTGLHAHAHSIFMDTLTSPSTVWFTSDGGVWRRQDAAAGTAWLNENHAPLGTLQFQSIAVHPTDRNFTIGGTQDNGTAAQQTTPGNWTSAEGGDGGFALIDQTATETTNVTMYHTFANLQNLSLGFARTTLSSCLATKDSWAFRGAGSTPDASASCDGSARVATNGINLSDNVNFYPPMALGPGGTGNPNTLYFGSDRLYRSTDKGDNMVVVSQAPFVSSGCGGPCPVTAISIAAGNDNVRLVAVTGRGGETSPANRVFATITASSTLTDISPTLPDNPNRDVTGASQKYISRAVIDPNNSNVAYLALSYFTPAGQGIFKTTNLNDTGVNPVIWTAAANGIPSIPINAFVVDPSNSNHLFAGTDIGVYVSEDAGANWSPYGTGLPRVAVFDMAIQPSNHILRVATHGRGMWEIAAGPTFSIDDVTHNEGNGGTTSYTFTVTKNGDTSLSSSVNFTTQDGSATTADSDYQLNSGTLNFGPADTSMQVTVLVNGDTKFEATEAFTVHLSGATGATISDADGTGTITNEDTAPTLAIDDVTHAEGNAGTTAYTFTVTKTGSTGVDATVNFTTQDNTATTADNDYQLNSGSLTFLPGDTTKQITVLVNGDTKFEGSESFIVHLSGASGATISDADGTGTITNEDTAPTLAIDDVTHAEGNAGTTAYTFTVTKTGSTGVDATVNFTTQDNTATTADNDYQLNSGSLTFLPADTTKQITVQVNGDTKFEGSESFIVHLSGASGATISDADGTGTITNEDTAPTLAIDDVTHAEGNAGTTAYTFTVTKTGSTGVDATVNFTTQDNTATTADNDYQLNSGSLTFLPVDTTKQITVLVNGDTKFEGSESFIVHLSGASGASLSDADGSGNITNDDSAPALAIDDVSHSEGNAGTTAYTFTVTKTGSTALSASVSFTTQNGTATTADNDYQLNSGTLTFLASDTTQQITVLVNGDAKFEADEAFTVQLSGVIGATLSDSSGTGTITNDDAQPAFSIDDVTHNEGNSGTTAYTFTVTKTGSTALASAVNFASQDGTATTADSDYQANSGTLNFTATDTTKQITVLVNGDTKFEANEAFNVHLSGATGASISDADGAGTITNDDLQPAFSIDDVTHNEGNSGTTSYTFTVTKTGSTALASAVNFATQDGTATTADSDYQANSGTLNFTATDTTRQITVLVNGDTKFEANEAFNVHLSGATGASISDADGAGTITNDDSAPTFSIDDVTHAEGNSGTTTYTFTVTKSGGTALNSSVNFTTQDNTATTANNDYQLSSGTLSFLPADTTKQITVLVNGDTLNEPSESFFVNLSNPTNAAVTDNQGLGTITNDDAVSVQLSATNYNVGEAGVSVTITVTRSGDISGSSTVDFASSDGTATQAQDYVVTSGTLNFAAGENSKAFNVLIVDDGYIEAAETFNVLLSSPVGAALGSPSSATVTINDNDTAGSISPAPKRFAAALDGAQETPANSSLAKGIGFVLLNGAETSAQVGLQFQNLGSAETAAHVHGPAAPGVPAPIVFPLPTTNPVINFGISPTAQQVADLKADLHYVNVHSNNFPNGEIRGQLRWNPTLEENFFVRQQYLDFLSRDGDAGGFNFWVGTIAPCLTDTQCFHDKTIAAADAFFFEPEFQQTAGFVFRAYRASFGNSQPFPNPDGSNPTEANKLIDYPAFVADRARVVGGANLAQSQQDFANLFVTRSAFTTKYAGATTAATFVDAILATIQTADSVDLTSQRQALIDQYNNAGGGNAGRAMVLYRLADDNAQNPINNQPFINAEYNRQFALTLYFGYLRRNPDINGFLFWQNQINQAPLRDVPKQNALVCSFITASEYQFRFGVNAPRTNAECPQ